MSLRGGANPMDWYSKYSPTPKNDLFLALGAILYLGFAFSLPSRTCAIEVAALAGAGTPSARFCKAATATPSVLDVDTEWFKFHRAARTWSTFFFAVALGAWGMNRYKDSNKSTAFAAVLLGLFFLITGPLADTYKESTRDRLLERYAATTPALYPAILGLMVGGLTRYLQTTSK